ncbi:ATP-binding protein [Salinirubellus salinus]|uniref:ATP-binding protein n=1 Tax=Salinirubellus salinus TaxID=1364945 RepID=A0A9E7U9D8_9EURY|nr:ATP-binding protein [Salinirubellus salinus]UWM52729.1 ATP-binding protein [Salinirubellus salinus]
MAFYDREEELAALERAFDEPGHDVVVLYGRRRVGKTELLKRFLADRDGVYYLAAQEAEQRQREKFVERIATHFGDRLPALTGWDDAFDYLGERLVETGDPTVVAIDEFPYLVEENDSVPSYLQGFVDEQLAKTDSMLVLCGSSISVMESEVLGHDSPLYGRRTAQFDLQPFGFSEALEAIDYPFEAALTSFSVTGGTPLYLTLFDYDQSLETNVREQVLTPTAVLYNEPEFLLRSELRNPARYMSILEAIASGRTTPNDIAGATGVETGPLSKYLQTLRQLRLVERVVPVTALGQSSKRSRYRVADEFLRFWFRFVGPNRSSIEAAPDAVYGQTIAPNLADHAAETFERVCQEAVWAAVRDGTLGPYGAVGTWWYGEEEIDVVGLSPEDDRILFGECKWTNEPVGPALVESLRAKASAVRWGPPDRTEQFALFSRSGFTDGAEAAIDESWELFELERLDGLLRTESSD